MKTISPEVILAQKIFRQKRIEIEEQFNIDEDFDKGREQIELDFKNSQYEIL